MKDNYLINHGKMQNIKTIIIKLINYYNNYKKNIN